MAEAGLEPPGADHTVSWGGGHWALCLCSLALVVERLLNTHEPEWAWGWPGRQVEDRRTRGSQAKGPARLRRLPGTFSNWVSRGGQGSHWPLHRIPP